MDQASGKWSRGTPVTGGEIEKAQSELGFTFPEDYREYLLLGGLHRGGHPPRGLWQLRDVVSLNASMPIFRWFPQILGIGNEGFTVYGLDYRKGEPGVVSLGWSTSDWADVSKEDDRFEDWIGGSL